MTTLKQKNIEPFIRGSKGKTIKYIDLYKKRINKHDYDFFVVVVGKERRGKSTLAINLAWYISNGKFKADQIAMDGNDFTGALRHANKGDVVVFDEAGTNLYSREAMSTVNRTLTKAFMVSGIKNVCIILCIPSFFNLDSYIRNHRIDLLFYIPRRGRWKSFSHKRAREISLKGAKTKSMALVPDNEFGYFTKNFADPVLEKSYRQREMEYKTKYLKEVKKDLSDVMSSLEFCEASGFPRNTIYQLIKTNNLKYKRIGSRIYVYKTEIKRLQKLYKNGEFSPKSSKRTAGGQ